MQRLGKDYSRILLPQLVKLRINGSRSNRSKVCKAMVTTRLALMISLSAPLVACATGEGVPRIVDVPSPAQGAAPQN